tara:strand:+ start:43 stop:471 length:429 start_codon:yes stop_codon:yes gene_type:complete
MNSELIANEINFDDIFEKCNWKYTKQRLVLLKNIFSGEKKHFCVNDINDYLKNKNIFFSYTTLFNNLNDLVENNFLSRIECGNQYFYDTNLSKHIHVYDRDKNMIFDFSDYEALNKAIPSPTFLKLLNEYSLVINVKKLINE